MTAWITRLGRPGLPDERSPASPTLLFHKWHAYDPGEGFKTKDSRVIFLDRVAHLANRALEGYADWHARYFAALHGLGAGRELGVVTARTVWRLVAGFATNPALETGITLHLLHGFPYLPGSAVRGLVRRVAESSLVESREEWLHLPELPPEEEIARFLDAAEAVWRLLGSLAVEPPDPAPEDPLWHTPRELLRHLSSRLGSDPTASAFRRRINSLLAEHTGGLLTFFDAVPSPGQQDLLVTDLLNPHYPDFYRESGRVPPSDDQDPGPIYFLAVRDQAAFEFPYRLRAVRDFVVPPELDVRSWLKQGLESWGAGAKTAAGYGYFKVDRA